MFSVIIPMFNSEKTIENTLDSIRNQTAIDLIGEVIIIDDGSKDDSYQIVKKYSAKHTDLPIVIVQKENGGVSSARNYGIKIAKYEWIALLDSDDCWLPKKIEVQSKVLMENSEILFLGTNRNNEKVKIGKKMKEGLYKLTTLSFLFKVWPSVPTVIFKKEIVNNIGYFDESANHGEDADFWLKTLRSYDIYYLEECLVNTGNGKQSFGEEGLSANLPLMHRGCIKLMKNAYKHKDINFCVYLFFLFYEELKYARRIILTKRRNKKQ